MALPKTGSGYYRHRRHWRYDRSGYSHRGGARSKPISFRKAFYVLVGLCPDNRISGGKVLSSHTRKVISRVSDALRIAGHEPGEKPECDGRLLPPNESKAGRCGSVTATAHKLARIIYRLIKHGEAYVRQGIEDYERKFQERKMYALRKTAKAMGFELIPLQAAPPGSFLRATWK
jgi:hypothetical protein